jgi:Tfp pilus assembly protein PilF
VILWRLSWILPSLALALACAGPSSPRKPDPADREVAVTYREIGARELSMGMTERAAQDLLRSLGLNDADPHTHHYLGLAYLQLDQYPDSEKAIARALELDPAFGEAHNTLGTLYSVQERWPEAEEAFRRALATPGYPTPEVAHFNLGRVYSERGDPQAARVAFEAALDANPAYLPPALQLADILAEAGDWQGAESTLRAALTRYPDSAQIHFLLGKQLYRRHRYRESLAALKEAMRLAEDAGLRGEVQRYIDILE